MSAIRRLRVFDCFGTIVFTPEGRPDHRVCAACFAGEFGCGETAAKRFIYPLVAQAWLPDTPPLDVAAHVVATASTLSADPEQLLGFLWRQFGPGPGGWRVPAAARDTLQALTCAGVELRMMSNCVLTAAQMQRALDDLGICSYFSRLMFSSDGGGKKPDRQWLAQGVSGGYDDVMVVGDSELFDLAPARELGLPAVRVRGPGDWDTLAAVLAPNSGPDQRQPPRLKLADTHPTTT